MLAWGCGRRGKADTFPVSASVLAGPGKETPVFGQQRPGVKDGVFRGQAATKRSTREVTDPAEAARQPGQLGAAGTLVSKTRTGSRCTILRRLCVVFRVHHPESVPLPSPCA